MSTTFLSSTNVMTIVNILSKIPIFTEHIEQRHQNHWVESQMKLIYEHNEEYAKEAKLLDFNKHAISILINILKQLKNQPKEETKTFETVEDTAITNLNELVEQQRRNRDLEILSPRPTLDVIELDTPKKVTWYDERHKDEYDKKIEQLEEKIRVLEDQLSSIKSTAYIDVCQTMNVLIKNVSGEN